MKTIIILTLLLCMGCFDKPVQTNNEQVSEDSEKNVILFLGDSLTAGYMLPAEQVFPSLLGAKWTQEKINYRSRNAGVSGYTSVDVLHNLNWYLTSDIHTVFLAIGANDGLRAFDLDKTEQNIRTIIKKCQEKKLRVVLTGIRLPSNLDSAYSERFTKMYPKLASELNVKLMPFLLEDVAGIEKYNLPDAIHPNAKGHRIIADNIHDFFLREKIIP